MADKNERVQYEFVGNTSSLVASVNKATKALSAYSDFVAKSKAEAVFDKATKSLLPLESALATAAKQTQRLKSEFATLDSMGIKRVSSALPMLDSAFRALSTAQSKSFADSAKVKQSLADATVAIRSYSASMRAAGENVARSTAKRVEAKRAEDALRFAIEHQNDAMGRAGYNTTAYAGKIKSARDSAEVFTTAMRHQNDAMGKARVTVDAATKSAQESASVFVAAAKKTTPPISNLRGTLDKLTLSLRGTSNHVTNLGSGFKTISKTGSLVKSALVALTGIQLGQWFAAAAKESINYVENLNLFNVAMSDSIEVGRDFIAQMQEVYGMDPSNLMRHTGNFYQLSDAIDMPAESAAKLALGLTKATNDISSLFNVDFEQVADNLSAGMQGMSRAVRKYGMDIRNSTLQQTALSLGIKGTVANMTEANRQGLRYITMMKQASNASGDFARTIETPANQLKIFKEQMVQLGRAIGNFIIAPLAKVLPYINGFIMALRMAINFVGGLFGVLDAGTAANGIADSTDAVDTLGSAADKAAKKAKALVAPFDELNVLQENQADAQSAALIGDGAIDPRLASAISDMELSLEKVRMKANDVRDALLEFAGFKYDLTSAITWDPKQLEDNLIKKLPRWKKTITAAFDNWDDIKTSLKKLGGTVKESAKTLFTPIGTALGNVFTDDVAAKFISGFSGVLDGVGTAIENWTPILELIPQAFANLITRLATEVDWTTVLESLSKFEEALRPFALTVGEGLMTLWDKVLVPLAVWTIGDVLPLFLDALSAALDALNVIMETLKPLGEWFLDSFLIPLAAWTGGLVEELLIGITDALKGLSTWISDHQQLVKDMTVVVLAFFAAWKIVDLMSNLGQLMGGKGFGALIPQLADLSKKLVQGTLDAIQLKLAYAGDFLKAIASAGRKIASLTKTFFSANWQTMLLVGGIALLVLGISELVKNWDKMSGAQQAVTILGAIATAAAAAAIAIGVFHASWSLGVAAAAIAGGVALLAGVYASVKGFKIPAPEMDAPKLPTQPNFSLPAMATGGVVRRPTTALIGEGAYDEAVIPLGNSPQMKEMLSQFAAEVKDAMSGNGTTSGESQIIKVYVGGTEVDAEIYRSYQRGEKLVGRKPIRMEG